MSTISPVAIPTGTWAVDPAHSRVEFAVRAFGISTVRGHFGRFEGTLMFPSDGGRVRASGRVRADSIDTNEERRDAHLRSADFFDVDNHPYITFAATQVEPAEGDQLLITGNLTMHGVTREITLEAALGGSDTDQFGNERVGLEVVAELDRRDFGMRFNQALGSGNMLVGDRVRLTLDISAIKQAGTEER
jgi:polyisoprenoid-binding protein YceI